ncbi:transposase [Natronococcus pandeyae]|uniref:Transposase n=1 Tax=Natronococcus pandeyae TaxID=2055836 RepID=A0A8J8PYN8_9EURY|nr:RNA-guided endonuclease TnpB family protein [Natronococcus pandeyae]TYL37286.1 transposase [Natronococcus pandeyae]
MDVHRTHRAKITNHAQVARLLDLHGWSASKLWNVGLYYLHNEWGETGEIPDEDELKSELKGHPKYNGLHSQSSQRVLEELAEAFTSWYNSDDPRDNPPGYRKENYYDAEGNRVHEEHPRSTITWKQNGFKHDPKHNRVRLSRGENHKSSKYAREYILVEYETRDDVTVENLQQVRAVYDEVRDRWELHLVCKHEMDTSEAPGEESAGVDLGINRFAAVAYSTGDADLYPGNRLKQDNYYFSKEIAKCDDSSGNEATRLHRKKSERSNQYIHAWAKHVADQCEAHDVGDVYIGNPKGIREDEETGKARNWGSHGNLDLHAWPYAGAADVLEYKLKVRGITLHRESERNTSKTCASCGRERKANRVERGLYECDECRVVAHGDVGGAENIRVGVGEQAGNQRESNSESCGAGLAARGGMNARRFGPVEDRSTGWLAQPGVYLYDLSNGFLPRDQVVDCKP